MFCHHWGGTTAEALADIDSETSNVKVMKRMCILYTLCHILTNVFAPARLVCVVLMAASGYHEKAKTFETRVRVRE